jgi:hypothetical protein
MSELTLSILQLLFQPDLPSLGFRLLTFMFVILFMLLNILLLKLTHCLEQLS